MDIKVKFISAQFKKNKRENYFYRKIMLKKITSGNNNTK